MISTAQIERMVDELTRETDVFPVEVLVRSGNRIQVFLDSKNGVGIDFCASVSRAIEGQLDREREDFELEVSSAGLDLPLRIPAQFEKNLGREADVVLPTGEKIRGRLSSCDAEGFSLESERPVRAKDPVTGRTKKTIEKLTTNFRYSEVKSTKLVISFKLEEKIEENGKPESD